MSIINGTSFSGLEEQRGWGGALEDCAAPPSSCELGCNEMETLRGLPGSGPALCSRERVANGGVAFFFLQHGSNSSSTADSIKCPSARQLGN